jgi:hypothetical protein
MVLGLQSRATAQDAARDPARENLSIEYRAPPECPDGEAFEVLVWSRLPETWAPPPEELARRVDVVVSGSPPSGYVATLELVDDGGKRITRAVNGGFCPDVVEGIALVTALAVQSPEEETLAEPTPANVEPASEPRPQAAPMPSAPAPVPAAAPPKSPRPQGEPVRPPPSVRVRTSARAALATGVGPRPAPGAGLGAVLERRSARLGVAFHGFWTGEVDAQGVPAHFELFAARLEGCPFVPELTRVVSLEPCVFAEGGSVTGEAYEDPPSVVRGFPGSALWLSTGGVVRGVGRFGALTLELEALLGASLQRERFALENGDELHRVPPVYGALAVGLGTRF